MIRISKLADYAIIVLSALSAGRKTLYSANALAEKINLPEPTVAKVLKLLSKGDLVASIRGAQGGYSLAREHKDISLAEVIKAVDGPIALTACVEASDECCSYQTLCPIKGRWDHVNEALLKTLQSVSVADMISPAPNFIDMPPKGMMKEDVNEQHL